MTTLEGVTHHKAVVNGVQLHWVERGSGPVLLLLHGFPEFWWSWRHQIAPLSQHFRVVAVDMRGFNESDKPETGYETANLALDIRDLIDHLSPNEPVYLAGHDWGGLVAYQTAMDWPDRVKKLTVLNAPHPDAWIIGWLTDAEQQRKSWYVFLCQLQDFPEEYYLSQFADGSIRLASVMSADDVAVYAQAFNKPGVATATINYYRELVKEMPTRRHTVPDKIRCPVRVLWGSQDLALEPSLNDPAAQWIDDFQVFYFPNCRHWLASEAPDEVTQHLLEFFTESA
jgi:pimeloyl-ACP methyl ester carboxylesterase